MYVLLFYVTVEETKAQRGLSILPLMYIMYSAQCLAVISIYCITSC